MEKFHVIMNCSHALPFLILSSQYSWGKIYTWAPPCPVTALLLSGSGGNRAPGLSLLWQSSEGGCCTPHLLLCAHHPKQSVGARSRRKIYGAGHLSMSLLFPPLFSEPCSLRCFTTFSKFPSCSSVWRICHDPVVHHQLQRKSPHKTFNHMISSSSQDIKVFLLPRLRETFKNTI